MNKHKLTLGLVATLALGLAACGEREAAPVRGVDLDKKIIFIGELNDESGPVSAIGRPWAVGKRMLAAQINAGDSGLLPEGWTVRLVERDHGYNPQRSVQLFNEIRDQVLFIGTSFGTPNTLPLRPMLARNNIVAFPASLSSKMAEFEYTPPLAPSYKLEAMRGLDFAAEHGDFDVIRTAVVYQQDDYGRDGLDAWAEAARQREVSVVSTQTYQPGQADYTAVVSALKRAEATHVLLTTVPSATGPILGTAAQLDYTPVWIANSPAWIDRFFDPQVLPPAVLNNFHVVSSVAYWGEDVPFMESFLEVYEKYGRKMHEPDGYILSSYVSGLIQIEAARRMIESGDISREGYFKAVRSIEDFTANGAFSEPLDLSLFPYVTGVQTRVLQPDLERRSWKVVSGFAPPTTRFNY